MTAPLKQRALRTSGAIARRLPSDRAQLFAFIASPAVRAKPWSVYQRLHRNGPVRPGPYGTWIVASHHGVSTVLRSRHASVDETNAIGFGDHDRSGAFVELMDRTLLFTDPPDHQRLRRLVSRDFTHARVAGLEPAIRQLTQGLLGALRPTGHGDLVADFALPLPVAVISELLGLPDDDHRQFLAWARDIAPRLDINLFRDAEIERRGDDAARNLTAYLSEVIEDPTRRRPEGLISQLVDPSGDDRLDRNETIALCTLLLLAGFETTANLIANSVHQLIQHPDQLDALHHDLVPIDRAVEELLRIAGPVQFTQRVLLEDLKVEGHDIPAGTLVALLIGAANRDPNVFDRPDQLDLDRYPNPHLAFSFGIHHCLGAALARLEAAIAIPTIFEELQNLRLLGRPRRRETFVLRGFTSLPARWST